MEKTVPPTPDERVSLVDPRNPAAIRLNFAELVDSADRYVDGTTADLIRDGYDDPHQWMMDGHADPAKCEPAFLIGRGWSATPEKWGRITRAGLPVMAVNNYPREFKPRYWCSGDGPSIFGNRIWHDPEVTKFTPIGHTKTLLPREDAYAPAVMARDAPNVHFFHHVNNLMELESWLFTPYIAWGTSITGYEGGPPQLNTVGNARSSMLIGLRLLWHLGYRRIYLLGCDCTPHHHPAPKYWEVMFALIDKIAPYFKRYGLHVFQTNPDSHLRTFEFADFDDVLAPYEGETGDARR
jgi:hypothetical protein